MKINQNHPLMRELHAVNTARFAIMKCSLFCIQNDPYITKIVAEFYTKKHELENQIIQEIKNVQQTN